MFAAAFHWLQLFFSPVRRWRKQAVIRSSGKTNSAAGGLSGERAMTKRYYTMKMLAKAATLAYGHKVSVSPVKKYLRRQGIRPRIVLGQAEGYSELAKESVERHFREEYTAYHVSKIPESMTLEDIERRKQAIRAARLELNKDSDPPRMCRTARVHTSNGGRTERTVRITYAKEAEITKPG